MTVQIPARCAHLPTSGGVCLPWANVHLSDGGADFRTHHNARFHACWTQGLCQVCGQRLVHPIVLLCGPNQLRALLFDEPSLHPECAVYVSRACPMVAGQRTHYADRPLVSHGRRGWTCPEPGCDCGGWIETSSMARKAPGGSPAHPWYAVYIRAFGLAVRPDGSLIGGVCEPADVLKVRLVATPGDGRCWTTVTDPLAAYEAPRKGEIGAIS